MLWVECQVEVLEGLLLMGWIVLGVGSVRAGEVRLAVLLPQGLQ